MKLEIIEQILLAFGLHVKTVAEPLQGYRNQSFKCVLTSKQTVNLMLLKAEPDIIDRFKRANSVAAAAPKQLPVRISLHNQLLQVSGSKYLRYATIYNYLPGSTVPWEAFSRSHLKQSGRALARFHQAVQAEHINLPFIEEILCGHIDEMQNYFGQSGVKRALEAKLGLSVDINWLTHTKQILKACVQQDGRQPLHLDWVRGNLLFKDGELSGILDFERVACGLPVFDIARSLAFLLVDLQHRPESVVYHSFLRSGYSQRQPNTFQNFQLQNQTLLEHLIDYYLFYDFYKFLRHAPYETLTANYHFQGTRYQLLQRARLNKTSVK